MSSLPFESKRTRSSRAMRPCGVASPATQSSSVVLPAPEAPKRMVKPGAAWNSTSRAKSRSAPEKVFRMRALKVALATLECGSEGIDACYFTAAAVIKR